jgi:hypothetical protein
MAAKDHVEEYQKFDFCALRAEPCKCSIDEPYIKNAMAKAKGWSDASFERTVNSKKGKFVFDKAIEAHHLVCCSPVRRFLLADLKVQPVIKATKWCINAAVNMAPMPLFGHTIKHYCTLGEDAVGFMKGIKPPKFKDIPQHDFDHNGNRTYITEVTADVQKLANGIKAKKKEHKIESKNIKPDLDTLSRKWDKELKKRGERGGGTHLSWLRAVAGKSAAWYLPFSMAKTADVTSRAFPPFDEKTATWMKRIQSAIWGK